MVKGFRKISVASSHFPVAVGRHIHRIFTTIHDAVAGHRETKLKPQLKRIILHTTKLGKVDFT